MGSALLIVDDEPHLLRLLVRVFEREGFTVLSAGDGDAAIATFTEHASDIVAVVLDVFIPPRGAAEVLEALLAKRPDVGVVIVSGDRLEPGLAARLEAVGGVFLRKPFRPRSLIDVVEAVTDRSSGGASD